MNRISDPYMVIKKSTEIPNALKEEIEEYSNSSLEEKMKHPSKPLVIDPYLDNRLRSKKPITFLGFIDDLKQLWEAAGKTGKIIRYTPIKDDIEFPVITYRIIRRIINPEFSDIKPRRRGTIRHPYMDNQYVDIYGQVFDLWVEFGIYSLSGEEADQLVMELEEFLQTYAGFFKSNGVQEILFHSQGEDEVVKEQRLNIAKRKLSYTMRFEKIVVRFLNEIEQIAVQAKIRHEEEMNLREDY